MVSTNDATHQSQVKTKRWLRKGTHSCWECKRRKMKCVFAASDSINRSACCHGCRRRGSQCVSQEFPDTVSSPPSGRGDTPTTQSPAKVLPHLALYEKVKGRNLRNEVNGHNTAAAAPRQATSQDKFHALSSFLYASLPSREDVKRIWAACPRPSVLAHEIMTMPYTSLLQDDFEKPQRLLSYPESTVHPALMARYMLLLASFLQHLDFDSHDELQRLSQSPRDMSERLADLAISQVTTEDELIGSIEGLECVMIESVYHANMGNLRRSWVACRRALSAAQLMGLQRSDGRTQYEVLDPKGACDPQMMWFRIVFLERFLCLMLGLPRGCNDGQVAAPPGALPMQRLERAHFIVASRILERNDPDKENNDLALTQALDLELQRAAREVPSKWWLIPKMDSATASREGLMLNTRRIFAQVLHYNLLNQLHLPYMLHSSVAERRYEYSRITCVNASREVLSRFIALRSFNSMAYSCRIVDFLALMAAMTLLLAHLDSNPLDTENLLAHQYHSDRAMIEQVQENMLEVNHLNSDALSAKSADLLQQLLSIDVDATNPSPASSTTHVSVDKAGTDAATSSNQAGDALVSVHIPYFGVINITNNNLSAARSTIHSADSHQIFPTRSMEVGEFGATLDSRPTDATDMSGRTQTYDGALSIMSTTADDFSQPMAFLDGKWSDSLSAYDRNFSLVAGNEDWPFQGVDLAFFDALMANFENK